MNRNKTIGWVSVIASAALIAGCSGSGGGSAQIDPPPAHAAGGLLDQAEPVMAAASNVFSATLFIEDADGYVAPLSVKLPFETTGVAATTLQYMVRGGPVESLLPEGFRALLPEGTEVLSLDIDQSTRTATIDFNKAFTRYAEEDERKILEAITWALTSFPTVDYVQLWTEGKWLKEMPIARTPLEEPLTRKFGINVERVQGVEYNRSTPVTLYFLNQTADNFTYYVPVTRMVALTDDIASATVAELVRGPLDTSKLDSVFLPDAKAIDVSAKEGSITVDFDGSILASNDKAPAEGLQSVVLSLTETTAAQGVQIIVDGRIQVIGTDDKNYGAQPVARPKLVNPYEL